MCVRGRAISGLLVLILLKNEWLTQKAESKYDYFPGLLFLFGSQIRKAGDTHLPLGTIKRCMKILQPISR